MDLTPDVLRGIEFRRKGRGYDADEVDAYRQKVEIWVGEAQARLREATSKLDEAETRAREAEERSRTNVESDETIQRTLLLAQRTADAAVAEAEETAGRKVAEAEAEAERLVTEARTHRERAIAEAEAEVREAIDLKRAELLDELTSLERVRDTLTGDVALLDGHIEGQRRRIQEARDVLGVLLDDPGVLGPVSEPVLSGVEVPEPAPLTDLLPEPEPEPEPVDDLDDLDDAGDLAEVLPEPLGTDLADDVLIAEAEVESDPWAEPTTESVFGETPVAPADDWPTTTEDAWADTPPPPPPPPPGLEVDESTWADAPPPPPPPPPDFDVPSEPESAGGAGSFGGLSGPAVPEQLPQLDEQAEEDNPWLAELSDQETGAEDGDRSRFGRRR